MVRIRVARPVGGGGGNRMDGSEKGEGWGGGTQRNVGMCRGGYRISPRGGRPVMDWCLNAIE